MTISGTIEQAPGDAYYFTDVLKGDIIFRSFGSNSFAFGAGSNVLSSLRVNPTNISMWANNIGFGTADPQALFHMYNGITSPSFILDGGGLGGRGAVKMINTSIGNYIQSGAQLSNDSKADLIFSSMMGNTEWMRIKGSTGNVGIGITNPLYSLHVPTTSYFSSNISPTLYTSNISTSSCNINIGCDSATNTVNIACGSNNQIVNIGTSTASTTINIGNAGDTVNIIGNTNFVQTTELQVSDRLITLNKGGAALSASGAGFEIEESNVITSYIKTSSDRNSFLLRTPTSTQDLVMNLSSGMNLNNGALCMSSTGNIGIGTTSPIYPIDVINTSNSAIIRVGQSDGTYGRIVLGNAGHGIARGAKISTATDANDVIVHTAGSGSVVLSTNGTEYMRVNNAGNVGIRTTSPTYALDINSTSMRLQGGASATPTVFYFNSTGVANTTSVLQFVNSTNYIACTDSNGYDTTGRPTAAHNIYYKSGGHNFTGPTQFINNVGIGTATPSQKLDINSGSIVVRNGNATGNSTNQILFSYAGNDTFKHAIKTRHSATNNIDNAIDFYTWQMGQASQTDIGTKQMMSITTIGIGIGKSNPDFLLDVGGSFNASNIFVNGAPLIPLPSFWTQANMGCFTGSNVGIGTSNYAAKLHIKGTGDYELQRIETTTSTDSGFISFINGTSFNYIGIDGVGWKDLNRGSLSLVTMCNNPIVFGTNNTQRLIITATGNVGIGTTTAISKLDVNGQLTLASDNGWATGGLRFRSTNATVDGGIAQGTNGGLYYRAGSLDGSGGHNFYNGGGTTSLMTITNAGNVGVGTATPLANLSVNNDLFIGANSANWNATTGKGLYMRYSTNGGTQDASYIQSIDRTTVKYYNMGIEGSNICIGNNTLQTTTPNLYVQYGGNVGIGTNLPAQKLDVFGAAQFGNTTNFEIVINDYEMKMLGIGYKHYSIYNSNSVFSVRDTSTATTFGVVGIPLISAGSYNVGIGTITPAYPFQVKPILQGTVATAAGNPTVTGTGTNFTLLSAGNNITINGISYTISAIASDISLTLTTNPVATASGLSYITSTDKTALTVTKNGNVGVGTTTPAYKLDVIGTVNATSVYQNGALLSPTGALTMFAGSVVPTGWLLCDGTAVSRTTYAILFAVISTTYGIGNGSTTFNLPDLRSRLPIGYNSGDANVNVLGKTGGANSKTLSTTEMPAHNHGVTDPGHGHIVSDPTHTHGASQTAHSHNTTVKYNSKYTANGGGQLVVDGSGTGLSFPSDSQTPTVTVNAASTGVSVNANTTGISIQNNGSGTAFSILNPYVAINYIIKS
jgi:microcystin-dependent protein